MPLSGIKISARGRRAPVIRRVLEFDPKEVYERIRLTADPLKRIQVKTNLGMKCLFPKKKDGLCDCGCGRPLTGKATRWADPQCGEFAWYVYAVIAGRRHEIRQCLKAYYGKSCVLCGDTPVKFKAGRSRMRSGIEFDHIVPVYKGGGACWLSNYRPLCVGCHKVKTKGDRLVG
jgi:5-methylcytosine-specific restriction endonuclease McrA